MSPLFELGGKRLPFLRWSLIRMVLGTRHLTTAWQVGDGRELALAEYVEAEARRGDPADVVRVIDDFAYHHSFLINVGDEKAGSWMRRSSGRGRAGCSSWAPTVATAPFAWRG
jgi:hypothetical protein